MMMVDGKERGEKGGEEGDDGGRWEGEERERIGKRKKMNWMMMVDEKEERGKGGEEEIGRGIRRRR